MKLVAISNSFFKQCAKYNSDCELLYNDNRRPYVLIVNLKYKENKIPFAIPFRSNIPATTPKNQYYSLPPRSTTLPGKRHGLHYIKMFPIRKEYLEIFRTNGSVYYALIAGIIEKNLKRIIIDCQEYLIDYETNGRPAYSPDIDKILQVLKIS